MNKLVIVLLFPALFVSCPDQDETDNSQLNNASDSSSDQIFELFEQSSSEVFYEENDDVLIAGIGDATIHNDQLFIIDDKDTKVVELSENGDLKQELGKSGRGPGEYVNPVNLGIDGDDLFLLDQSLARITKYNYDKSEVRNSESYDMTMSDMCIDNEEIWVHSSNEGNILHKIDDNLQSIETSMGDLYDDDEMVQQEISSDGKLTCDDEFIYSGFINDNKIQVYDKKSGTLHEQFEFEKIKPMEISLTNLDGQQAVERKYYVGNGDDEKGDYHDFLKNMVKVEDALLVQYERNFENADSDTSYLVSVNIDLKNNTFSITEALPNIYDYQDGTFVSGSNYPLPNIKTNSIQN